MLGTQTQGVRMRCEGTVKMFFSEAKKRYGFLYVEGRPKDLFFHMKNACACRAEDGEVLLQKQKLERDPQPRDVLVFETGQNDKGREKAKRWAFKDDFDRAAAEASQQKAA